MMGYTKKQRDLLQFPVPAEIRGCQCRFELVSGRDSDRDPIGCPHDGTIRRDALGKFIRMAIATVFPGDVARTHSIGHNCFRNIR